MNLDAPVQILPGITYLLPEVACGTVVRIHPDYPTLYEDNAAWAARSLPFDGTEALTRMLECRYPLWDCLSFPAGIRDRILQGSCVTSLMFEVDDIGVLRHALFDDIAAGTVIGHPYQAAFAELDGALRREMPPRVYLRYREAWRDWFTEVTRENEYRRRRVIPDLDTYLDLRRVTVGLWPYVIAAEYYHGLDLTDALAADPELARLGAAAIEHTMLVNDLFSFRAEVFKGDYISTVAVLLHQGAGTLQQAVDTVAEMIREADDTVAALSDSLRRRYRDPAVLVYVEAVNAFCAGNLRWSLETTRYIGHGNAWNGRRSGRVTLDANRTTFE